MLDVESILSSPTGLDSYTSFWPSVKTLGYFQGIHAYDNGTTSIVSFVNIIGNGKTVLLC
jgi:hypothetical protein